MNTIDAYNAIAALDLDRIKLKLMHVSGEGWSRDKADAVEVEYRRFLVLTKLYPEEQVSPLVEVDIFWHYHILDTQNYAQDCEQAFGFFVHHQQYMGMEGTVEDTAEHGESIERMRELYEATFEEAYGSNPAAYGKDEAAFCARQPASMNAAFCGRVRGAPAAAFCGRVRVAPAAAFCARSAPAAKAAFCARSTPASQRTARGASSSASSSASRTAFCARTPAKSAGAFCARTPVKTQAAFCARSAPDKVAAFCARSPLKSTAAFCARTPANALPACTEQGRDVSVAAFCARAIVMDQPDLTAPAAHSAGATAQP